MAFLLNKKFNAAAAHVENYTFTIKNEQNSFNFFGFPKKN